MTRTAATLLVGVAVSAVSGCVSADAGQAGQPGRPGPPAVEYPAAQQPHAPQLPHLIGNGGSPDQLVEAPVHEVLEAALLPSERVPGPAAAPPATGESPRKAERDQPKKPARRDAPEPPAPHQPAPRHKPDRKPDRGPALPKLPTSAADVCALGTGYGGWKHNSPEARICRETYGG
ncbi:hypothetical protein OG897_36195 [Streptomyces sp. NBC_00237]|uniref:hypothetical protein n=1 Tax=Streptomyces sp. NBC_00237 TaxID=2975687 RepID=UPI002258E7C8|nr:hypothetical protein [Streptomyces sp. NBC_00237]MCX5206828.1 hypothetical protein [Streptomyces sp. NBC_00237]